jgi:hypothetical protein
VLAQTLDPGSTVEVELAPDEDEREVTITIDRTARKREAVGVGAKGGEDEQRGSTPDRDEGPGLPDEPDVLPDVPDAPPPPEGDGEPDSEK